MTQPDPPPTAGSQASSPRLPASGKGELTCHRQIARQATSAVAHTAPPPEPGDPLLDFEPVPHKAPRRNSITADLQRDFIAHLAATGIVSEAARHIGKSMEAIYKLRQRPGAEGFRAAWDAALDRGVSRLESGALARAIEGEERMVVSGGKVLGTELRHNDALVMFFLKNRLPDRYNPAKNIGPGHPVYERVKAEYEEEQRRIASDPERIARVRASIDRKFAQWRRDIEAKWEAERQAREARSDASKP
ncbi:MAG: hypothetical protein ACX930_03715 [Erythrobacter sp.]